MIGGIWITTMGCWIETLRRTFNVLLRDLRLMEITLRFFILNDAGIIN